MPIRALLFDLDGTLLDTLADLGESMNGVLSARGHPVHPLESYKIFVGNGMDNLVRRALPAGASETEFAAALSEMRAAYDARGDRSTLAYPGIIELLDSLKAMGIALAVLSNKPDAAAKRVVEKFFGPDRFAIVAGQRADIERKPDPAGALAIAARLSIDPADILYAGDSSVDIDTARAAGMPSVGVLWGFRGMDELLAHGARFLAERPSDILEIIRDFL